MTVDGIDLAGCRTEAWRRELAWVPQHPTVLRGTVADNIRLGDHSASDAQIRQASALAGADGFIAGLSRGYETFVGDGAARCRRVSAAGSGSRAHSSATLPCWSSTSRRPISTRRVLRS